MGLRDEETVHHLFIHCNFARNVWMILFARFGISWVMPWSVEDLFQQWNFKCQFARGRILWKFLLYAFLWKVWLERNNRIFKNNSRTVEDIVEIIVRTVSEWATTKDAFQGVFLDDLNRSWDAVLKGGWRVNSSRPISWMPPPSVF
eukprot:TRINITY_DN3077_c0_g1_i1.p1 TRINITY_DN3077_c0_g1~~TRINITY_DN3077_c0_g1_i1.p1  ORF type:complete len:146 (+),score=15.04 TRINITY_DN3077_c0_g1_i1:2680-3117(+)